MLFVCHPDAAKTDKPLPTDPADWPAHLTDTIKTEFVRRGPNQLTPDFIFPRRDDGRSCHHQYFSRTLINGERIKRSWLTYSKTKNSLFCFCCQLFSPKHILLTHGGLSDWKNASAALNSHDNSQEHLNNLASWKELAVGLKQGTTIDKKEQALLEAEQSRWRAVLTRLVAIVQSLAWRNMSFRGHSDKLHSPSNGNFLKEVELMALFDPVMKDHIHKVKCETSHHRYLGKTIQNELIQCISGIMLSTMVQEIKKCKYFSLILDCTPDVSHIEQLSVVIRIVTVEEDPRVKEHFLGFLVAEDSTGESLSALILKRLEELDIAFDDCRGQSYDNGANMKGKNKGVQARLLQLNPRALFMPCGAHTLNLVISDAAKSSKDAISFFGIVQKLYCLFSASTQRWAILKQKVNLSLKMWSETRWESRVKAVEPLRYEAAAVREALLEVRNQAKDPMIRIEAQSLAEEVGSFRFSLCTVVWYDVLNKIQHVSKLLQSQTMQVDVAVSLLKKTQQALESYRATGFVASQTSAKAMCEEMNVDAVLVQKRLKSTKRHFSYESPDEPLKDALQNLEVTFFNVVVDVAVSAHKERFTTLKEVEGKFGILSTFPDLPHQELMKQAEALAHTLSHGGKSDLDGKELAQELESLPDLPSKNMSTLELFKFIQTKQLTEIYPNLCIALRISATLPVTVASAERSFSKLKLLKTYLRSTMAQERLSGLAVISINHEVGGQIQYNDVIDDFAARKARRTAL